MTLNGLTAETVIGALEDAEDYKAFELAITADYDAQSKPAIILSSVDLPQPDGLNKQRTRNVFPGCRLHAVLCWWSFRHRYRTSSPACGAYLTRA